MTGIKLSGNADILHVIDAVAAEKSISKEVIFKSIETSVASAAQEKFGVKAEVIAKMNKQNGEINTYRCLNVVEEVEDPDLQISLKSAKELNSEVEVGQSILDPLPQIDIMRTIVQTIKNSIMFDIRSAEKEAEYNEFKKRVDEIVTGVVKKVARNSLLVNVGKAEAIIYMDNLIPKEQYRINDKIVAHIKEVNRSDKDSQIVLSRTTDKFVVGLFANEVPEIVEGIIEVKGIAREPGSRVKIAVFATDSSVDAVGACVGIKGSRVQAIMGELKGEKIDVIDYKRDTAQYLVNAIVPAKISKITVDEDRKTLEVVVPSDNFSIAVGRKGQNIRLTSRLLGWSIDLLTEEQDQERRVGEFNRLTQLFVESLNVEEIIAQLLVSEGYTSLQDIIAASVEDLSKIEGFDADVAAAIQQRATEYQSNYDDILQKKIEELKVDGKILEMPGITKEVAIKLAESNIKTLKDFAELSRDDFTDIIDFSNLTAKQIDDAIMSARYIAFE